MSEYTFYGTCVGWHEQDVYSEGGLVDMIDRAIDITRETFLKHVPYEHLQGIAGSLGYERHASQGLTMAGDYHVSYHRSKLHGARVYFFKHSAIEHVFTDGAYHD